jgi:ferritin
MLSEKMLNLLTEQIAHEYYSANLYLAMSSWCGYKGLRGSSAFLQNHSDEELGHMRKLFSYIADTGAHAIVPEVRKPPQDFESIRAVFTQTLDHEIFITKKINELVSACLEEKDYSTFNFLQWYVGEQHEEERLFRSILDLIALIGTDGRGLYLLDKEIGKFLKKTPAAPQPSAS